MLIGHKKQQQFLKKIVKSGKIPHALLFSGQEKLGKKTAALELISSLFKENPLGHPDFILVAPQTKHPSGQIQISQIRNLNWKLSLRPVKAPFVGAIIDQAHLMTREAQNCFLKTLEEPKGRTLLILITEHPNSLLATILSRCEVIKFYPVKKEEIGSYLREKGISKEKIKKIVKISLGRPGVAIDFLQNPQKLKERTATIKELIKISNSPISLRFQYVKKLSKDQNLKEVLTIWLSHFRDTLISQRNRVRVAKIENILNLLQRTIFLISTTNVNPRLALEVLMLEL
ncbi:MAG: hypothetical protein ACE5J0_03135 [Candidatus Paceibacterales bacterium]